MIAIELPLEDGLKQHIDDQMDDMGQITLDEDIAMQVIPEDDFNFAASPELIQGIQLVVNAAGNIALSIIASWLYENIKSYKLKTVKIAEKQYTTDSISVDDLIKILEEQNK